MKKDDMFTWLIVAAGGLAAYWYLTHYGPSGAVNDANGNAIPGAVSYWASWFGGGAAAVGAGAGPGATTAAPGATTMTTAPTTGVPAIAPTSSPVSAPAPVTLTPTAQALVSASGGNPNIQLTASQWNFYFAKIFGQPSSPILLGDNGQPMSIVTYIGLMQQAGLISTTTGQPILSTGPAINVPVSVTTTGPGSVSPIRGLPIMSTNPNPNTFSGDVPVELRSGGVSGIVPLGMSFGGGSLPKKEWKN